jgi:hypothetical protein
MALLGGLGLGLVWGWWLVLLGSSGRKRPLPFFIALILPTLLFPWLLEGLAGWETAVTFLGATFLSLFTHLAWRQKLAQALYSNQR